jgi:iron complex transport system substrate-binding protein
MSSSLKTGIVSPVRIASLVPSATETLFALGLGSSVVGVTHECDYPEAARDLPSLTRSVLPPGLSSAEIDAAVKERTRRGESIYELDADVLASLDPELIVTQAVCEVCAVSYDDVRVVAEEIESRPKVLSLDPSTLGEVVADFRRLAQAAGAQQAGRELAAESAERIDRVREAVANRARPVTVALEWLDPPYAGGHWVPQMIDLAGGEDPIGHPGERSRVIAWEDVEAAQPDVVVSMPCGYDLPDAGRETLKHRDRLAALAAARVIAVDASAYFSRPGPRLIDGIELLAAALHPDAIEPPPRGRSSELDLESVPRPA